MANEDHVTAHIHKGWIIALVAVVALFGAFVVGAAAGRFSTGPHGLHTFRNFDTGTIVKTPERLNVGLMNSQDRAIGTVTAVNGSDLTVAGGGSSYNVQTDSSTQWQNGNTAKVNDTVIAYGTTNNGVLTATQIIINP